MLATSPSVRRAPPRLRAPGSAHAPACAGVFPAHVADDQKLDKAVAMLTGLRSYLLYHIKASKSYLHTRMRRYIVNMQQGTRRAASALPCVSPPHLGPRPSAQPRCPGLGAWREGEEDCIGEDLCPALTEQRGPGSGRPVYAPRRRSRAPPCWNAIQSGGARLSKWDMRALATVPPYRRTAASMSGTGARLPLHRRNWATPCASSMSMPSTHGQPQAAAWVNRDVRVRPYAASRTTGREARRWGGTWNPACTDRDRRRTE